MSFFFSGMFWGSILILLGISVVLKAVFHINLPIFRLAFAALLIYCGVKVLMGGHWGRVSHSGTILFSQCTTPMHSQDNEYNIIFSRGVVDTSILNNYNPLKPVTINTIFGSSLIKVPRTVPTIVHVDAAFSGVTMPDGNVVSFGTQIYRNSACKEMTDPTQNRKINVDVVFGGCQIVEE